MNELNKKIIELEKEYFDIIYELFSELILFFENDKISIEEAVRRYLAKQRQTTIFISQYKDNHSLKREKLHEKNMEFWNNKKDIFIDFIVEQKNVGVFGVGDNTFASEYLNEIKRNSLFYDILVFNDPFYAFGSLDENLNYDSNAFLFYSNILYVWETKRYLSVRENEVFTIIFPFDLLLMYEEEKNIMDDSHGAAISWTNEIFGITADRGDLASNIEKIKKSTIDEIQKELYKNGIYQNYVEALNYSQKRLSENIKKEIEVFCFESWGNFNKDFVRCLLSLEALPTMATVSYYIYKMHFLLSMRLKSNPIMSRNEWAPMKRDLKNQSLKASGDYMYTCAIHRNDQMATLMDLDYDEIIQYHNRKQCADFREFFNKATSEIVKTYADVDEIANEVYVKTDDLLLKEYQDILSNKKRTKKNAIIGFFKGGLGFVPILSYVVSAFDMGISVKDYVKTLDDRETVIEYLNERNGK